MVRLMRASICCIAMLAAGEGLPAADTATSPDDVFLNSLEGHWTMTGVLLGKPVQYHAQGERVLQGGFLRLHMIDAAATAKYEADVYLGFDAHQKDYIVHWLDGFGAAGARVVATGQRRGAVLTVIFPYAEGRFRDTFEWQEKTGTWVLIIESENKDGGWSPFARYDLVRS